ncbi:hypothetical protein Sste5346_000535 [Sporothrix stenoceras]|uniref:Uncharacterized protein n=1 Tax=Sporothrix stenoceras TaxID=5173 RepID=A0ABR3ZRD0_9PEZI
MATTTSPSGSRSPTTPTSSVSSVRAMISRLEKSGGNEKEINKPNWKDREKITPGRVSSSHIQALSPTNQPQDIPRPVPTTITPAPKIKATGKRTDWTPKEIPEKATEKAVKKNLDKEEEEKTKHNVTVAVLEKTAEKDVLKQTEKAIEKAPVKALGDIFEKKTLKTPSLPKAAHSPAPLPPAIPFSPTRTLFPRDSTPVRRTSASTASLSAVINRDDGTPSTSTPSTPSWRRRQFAEDNHDRVSLVSASPSLPAMPTRPITPATPKTPTTPIRTTAKYSEAPEDYSLTLLRYKAYFERPLARCLDEDGEMDEEETLKGGRVIVDEKEKEIYDSTPRRLGKDVDAFWAPVRQYLLITDEELYDS